MPVTAISARAALVPLLLRADLPVFAFIAIGLLAFLVGAGITVAVVLFCYRSKKPRNIYPIDRYATLSLRRRNDIYIGESVQVIEHKQPDRKEDR